jgi:hypothetical protein
VAELARKNQFAENLEAMMCELISKLYSFPSEQASEEKEINLVEILKHYPRETELYSPLYGKLWLAEVDEEHGIITCYKHHLDEGCTRAILEQEDIISFYSNGTTGLPDCSVSKDCMLFLYDKDYYKGKIDTYNGVLQHINSISVEQPSEELKKVASIFMPEEAYHAIIEKEEEGSGESVYDYNQMVNMFITGAQWQKGQFLKSAISGCYIKRNRYNKENVLNGLNVTCNAIQKFKDGDKVKILIIKEEEK